MPITRKEKIMAAGPDGPVRLTPPAGRLDELLTAGEVGERLRLPLSTVYYLAKSGRLQGFRVGRSWRFPLVALGKIQAMAMPQILLVDELERGRALLAGSLRERGCSVEEAGAADEALVLARHYRFDVLMIDLTVPGMDGAGVMQELRDSSASGQLVVITAVPELADVRGLCDLGAVTLLPKPIATGALVACVERMTGAQLSSERRRL